MLMPYAIFRVFVVNYYTFDIMPIERKMCASLGVVLYLALMGLNFYWFVLISRGVGKMLGCIKSSSKKEKDEKYTKVNQENKIN